MEYMLKRKNPKMEIPRILSSSELDHFIKSGRFDGNVEKEYELASIDDLYDLDEFSYILHPIVALREGVHRWNNFEMKYEKI